MVEIGEYKGLYLWEWEKNEASIGSYWKLEKIKHRAYKFIRDAFEGEYGKRRIFEFVTGAISEIGWKILKIFGASRINERQCLSNCCL